MTTTKTRVKTTAIRTPTDEQGNHTIVLTQLKEVVEVGQRLRGDPMDSFVRVSDLVNANMVRLVNGTVQPPSTTSGNFAPGVPLTRNVNTVDSLTGGGALSADLTLELVGDVASPGNTMLYGTNSSGVRGWYAQPSSGGGTAVPGTIPDLLFWYETDDILTSLTGTFLGVLHNRCPWAPGNAYQTAANNGPQTTSTKLNSLQTMSCPNTSSSRMWWLSTFSPLGIGGQTAAQWTIFAILNPTAVTAYQAIFGGTNNSLCYHITSAGKPEIVRANSSTGVVIGTSTTALSAGTFVQMNVTYNNSSGAWAHRVSRAAAGSGTTAGSITAASDAFFYDRSGPQHDLNATVAALIIYNRVLTNTEITNVETYLNGKWGV